MMQAAIRVGLTSIDTDFGQTAGEECFGFGANPGLESKQMDLHAEVVHLSALSDIIATAVRKPTEAPWSAPEPTAIGDGPIWRPDAYLDPSGTHLRRIAIVTNWSDDRHYAEARSWRSLGEVCVYGLPMQQVVVVLGARRDGKRHGFWSKGLRHPVNKKLRLRKRNDVGSGFKESWIPIWREDFDDISTKAWLAAMHEDGVLSEVCFSVEVPVSASPHRSGCPRSRP